MKILSLGNFGRGWDGSICDELHISEALNELGHETFNIQRENWETLPNVEPDFILLAQWDGFPPEFVPKLRGLYKCPVVFWCYDYQADGQEWHERLIAESDLYLSKRIADSKYPNWQWLSQDFAPKFLETLPTRTFKDEEQPIDVLFTGSYLDFATERNDTLLAINDKFKLVIHSVNAWPEEFKDVRPPIMDEELPGLYKSAKIIIAIDHTLERGYWSDRVAQILCCGGFVLNRYIPMMETRFPKDLVYFYSIEDCLKKVEEYLSDDPKRAVIASHNRAYADNYLRVNNRVQDLLTIVRSIL